MSQRNRTKNIVGAVLLALFAACGFSMIYPVFRSARAASEKTQCCSNLKQLAIGELTYSSNFDDRLPAASKWLDLCEPYLEAKRLPETETCPSLPAGSYGYGMNQAADGRPVGSIDSLSTTVMLFETRKPGRNAFGPAPPRPGRFRHGFAWRAFLDGHVSR